MIRLPWLPIPEGWSGHAIELQQQIADSTLALTTRALEARGELLASGVLGTDDAGP